MLLAQDIRAGVAHKKVVQRVREVRISPERALRLSYDPVFLAEVAELARVWK